MEMISSLYIYGYSNRTESTSDRWRNNSPYVATLVMSIVAVSSWAIIFIYCCCTKKCRLRNDSKVASELTIDQKEATGRQNDFHLPPDYSTLGQ